MDIINRGKPTVDRGWLIETRAWMITILPAAASVFVSVIKMWLHCDVTQATG